MKNSSH